MVERKIYMDKIKKLQASNSITEIIFRSLM